jgi:hypothetical protein
MIAPVFRKLSPSGQRTGLTVDLGQWPISDLDWKVRMRELFQLSSDVSAMTIRANFSLIEVSGRDGVLFLLECIDTAK